ELEVGELAQEGVGGRPGDDAGAEDPRAGPGRLLQRVLQYALDLRLLRGVRHGRRTAGRDVLGEPVRVVVVEAVSRDAGRVAEAFGPARDRSLEDVPRPRDIDRAARVARLDHREGEVHVHVGALDGVAHAVGV